jgi:hypothetical protein
MKRPALSTLLPALLFSAALLPGCDAGQDTVVTYNPRLDGITPPTAVTPDLSLLEDQKHRYEAESKNVKPGSAANSAATPGAAPASAPGAPAAGGPEPAATGDQPATPAAPSPPAPPAE